jgi:DEAD/DEAH box helicase domain-containing protein
MHELAPSNQFYAEGRKVRIDQIDMRLSEVEAWRFCNACPHTELVTSGGSAAEQCPRCGSALWADDGQVRRMLKLRQVVATTTDRDSRIQDDSDQREPGFFTTQMLVRTEAREIVSAYRIDAPELPFGYEYLQKADFREINFGHRNSPGDTMHIAGQSVPQTGFMVCRTCGKVAEAHHLDHPENFKHAIGCPARRSGSAKPVLDCLYLYREFSSEAIRMLLPVTSFAGSEQRLQSFIAAVILGLEHTFHGNIDHLEATVQEEPMPDHASLAKKYLVLYDRVPGGTGYLKELAQSEQAMMNLFERALTVLRRCACQDDTSRDGCYRCVYAYRNSFERPDISRRTAIASLTEIVHCRDRLVPTDTVARISQNSFLESELEAYFIEALHRERFNGLPVQLSKDIVHHKTGWYCQVNGYGYYIEPQVELSGADGVPMATRPDFVITPERQKHGRAMAVYLDGFAHHADTHGGVSRVGDDLAKRMGLVRSGRYHVWSLTWNDIESRFNNGACDHFVPLLQAVSARQKKLINAFDHDTGVGRLGDVNRLDSLSLLVCWLAKPQQRAWQASAAIQMLVQMDMQGCDGDDLELELEQLLGEGSPWVAALRPSADGSALVKGALVDTEAGDASVELLTWVTMEAIRCRDLEAVRVVCCLRDLGDMSRDPGFKRAWNGFLRLYNLMQFLPECLFVTEQGLRDDAYQALEFVRASETTVGPADADDTAWVAYAELVEGDVLAALRVLASHGVRLPAPESVPFELCGPRGDIIAQAELAWEEYRMAFVYADDKQSQRAFAEAGWTVRHVEDLIARPADVVPRLQGGDHA